ncbi:MAG: NAD(P)-dependent oxidoreductase [Mangrovicoccus sp.]|nr:NAD(P)-dependent oxidoreductase [Mangrovicoccus sp.]
MRLAITGGTGLVGQFITRAALLAGHEATLFGRRAPQTALFGQDLPFEPFDLGGLPPDLRGFEGLIHGAFDHIPGRYRGGEGDDPEGFRRRNVLGSQRLIESMGAAGGRVIFLSSRAAYGDYPPGTALTETTPSRPETLYGQVKLAVEQITESVGGVSLRATGVYGAPAPGQRHKWADLFADFAANRPIAPRRATELHGEDLAAACMLALQATTPALLNVSDIMLDRRDLLALWSDISGIQGKLPKAAPEPGPAAMDCSRLKALGWAPQGDAGLAKTLAQISRAG